MSTYQGFSTYNRNKKFRVSDFELAKQDLFNHLHIRKGEKLMNPNFGTIIWGMLFEPLNSETKRIITKDLTSIVKYDPRLSAQRIDVTEYEQGLQITIELMYIPTNQVSTLKVNFDRSAAAI